MSAAVAVLLLSLAQTPPVFRAEVEQVYVDVFVTSGAEPVTGLTAADFSLSDNGVGQTVSLVDVATVGVTAVLVFDASQSVAGEKLGHLKAAGRAFVAGLTPRDTAALIGFSHEVVLLQPPTADRDALRAALDGLEAGGATSVIDAAYVALKREWGSGRPLILVFTDGEDTASWLENEDLLAAGRESPALVQVVGTEAAPGTQAPPGEDSGVERFDTGHVRLLRELAETTGGGYWYVDTGARLESALLAILSSMKTRYLLSYEPRGVRREGRHKIKVSVKRRKVQVRARQEYVVVPRKP